jgi:hypothetical protein
MRALTGAQSPYLRHSGQIEKACRSRLMPYRVHSELYGQLVQVHSPRMLGFLRPDGGAEGFGERSVVSRPVETLRLHAKANVGQQLAQSFRNFSDRRVA